MAMQMTNADFSIGGNDGYRLFTETSNLKSTEIDQKSSRPNFLTIIPSFSTENNSLLEGRGKTLRLHSAGTVSTTKTMDLNKSVDGVVSDYDDVSVKCEMRVGDGNITLQLPRALFPKCIKFGLPISLELVNDDGIRKPLISMRNIPAESNADIADEFDDILNSF